LITLSYFARCSLVLVVIDDPSRRVKTPQAGWSLKTRISENIPFFSATRRSVPLLFTTNLLDWTNGGFHDWIWGLHWKFVRKPGINPASKGADSRNSLFLQQQRHPGAGRFIRSRAVEDNLSIARDFLVTFFKLFHSHAQSAGYDRGEGLNIERPTQVHNHNLIAGG
jgi:hypothetical protein